MGPLKCTYLSTLELRTVKRGAPVCSENDVNVNDFGLYFKKAKDLTASEKYNLMKNYWKPNQKFDFPYSQEGSSKRRFNPALLQRHPWLAYSQYVDGCFCVPCTLFSMRTGRNTGKINKLLSEPLTLWPSVSSKLRDHEEKYIDCLLWLWKSSEQSWRAKKYQYTN